MSWSFEHTFGPDAVVDDEDDDDDDDDALCAPGAPLLPSCGDVTTTGLSLTIALLPIRSVCGSYMDLSQPGSLVA